MVQKKTKKRAKGRRSSTNDAPKKKRAKKAKPPEERPRKRGSTKKAAKKKRRKRAPVYEAPPEPQGEPGTIGVEVDVRRGETVDINIPAAIEFLPESFCYTGTPHAFLIQRVFMANNANANFGSGYWADLHTGQDKLYGWPRFYNSPPLTLTVTNTTRWTATFSGLLKGKQFY